MTPVPQSRASEAAVEAVGRAIHGYACGCREPWPTNANVEEMASAALNAAVQEIVAFIRPSPLGGTPINADDFDRLNALALLADRIEELFTASSSSEGAAGFVSEPSTGGE